MTALTMQATTPLPYDDALALVRAELADAGFGVITEIDIAATLQAKLGVDTAPQVILGACRPELAHTALQTDPSIAALLPCNVVVRAEGTGSGGSVVEAFDPAALTTLAPEKAEALHIVADDARSRLVRVLDAVRATV